jgi:Zn-finger nucleic acid-binding protein
MKPAPKEKSLKCPECGAALRDVYAEANYGRVLLLKQCKRCGGVWFERWELYFLKDTGLASLASVDIQLLGAHITKGGDKPSACPECSKELKPFTDPLLPKDARILRCPGCSGLWLNRVGIRGYADYRASLKKTQAVLSPDAYQKRLEVLKKLQKELDTKGLQAEPRPGPSFFDMPEIDRKEFAKDFGFLILQALFRLVFKV